MYGLPPSPGTTTRRTKPRRSSSSTCWIDPGDPAVLTMDPRQRHAAIVQATHLLLERGAELRPHVVVLEDMHWCDPATEDWIARLADGIAAKRVLLVVTCRPGYRHALGRRELPHRTGPVHAVRRGEPADRAGLLGVEELPPALQRARRRQGRGQSVLRRGARALARGAGRGARDGRARRPRDAAPRRLAVPDTIEDVLLARIAPARASRSSRSWRWPR